jgi:Fe(3+) dicitrate transport protein
VAALASLGVEGEAVRAEERHEAVAPRVDVIGTPENLAEIGGTATIITSQELEAARVFTTAEALRKAPGVYVRDEEGFGLRPNIGIRGLNPTRSTKVLLLEDGIPLSYAPYGDNASYYHPPVERFERIEVFKGAEQIRFGPQTAGGAINYITPVPTGERTGRISLAGGNRGYFNGHVRLGTGPVLFDYVRKQGDGSRDNTHATINDINLKSVFDLGDAQAVILRANYYTEDSDVTYTGITEAEYSNFGPEYNPFRNDTFNSKRVGLSATHQVQFNPATLLLTNVYYAYFDRDWWRQSSRTTDTQCGTVFRDARIAGQPVDPGTCNSTQGRLRAYNTYGVEPRLFVEHRTFGIENHLELAVRAHCEVQDRRQENGNSPTARTGTVVEDNERRVDAYSAFVENRFVLGRFTVTPGVRVENIHLARENRLTGASGSEEVTEVLPGLAATFALSAGTTLFAGVHRGFSPPRVEDLINNSGTTAVAVPIDDAIETEIGVRTARPGLQLQAAVFRNDFDQQVAVGSVAGGDLPLAVGEALYQGLEVSGRADFGMLLGSPHKVYLRGAYQWLPTAEIRSPFTPLDPARTLVNAVGNRVPYAPRHLLTLGLGYTHPAGLTAEVEAVYTSEQFSDFANTQAPTPDATAGIIDGYTVVNLALNYALPGTGWTTFFTIKNLFDEAYVADRTRGILPGTPRLYQAGIEYRF